MDGMNKMEDDFMNLVKEKLAKGKKESRRRTGMDRTHHDQGLIELPSLTDEEVWLQIFCACVSDHENDSWEKDADWGLKVFRDRFPNARN